MDPVRNVGWEDDYLKWKKWNNLVDVYFTYVLVIFIKLRLRYTSCEWFESQLKKSTDL